MNETETTRLIPREAKPPYVFESNASWQRKRRIRQFQCCLCGIFMCALMVALVVTVSMTLDDNTNPTNNQSNISSLTNDTLIILTLNMPIDGYNSTEYLSKDNQRCIEAMNVGIEELRKRDEADDNSPLLDKDTPSYRHQKIVATSQKGYNMSRIGYAEVQASKKYFSGQRSKNKTVSIMKCPITHKLLVENCIVNYTDCNKYHMFRSYNGSCNNLKYPQQYGVSYTPFRRVLPPDYADGISEPRRSKSGYNLPSARTVSNVVHRPYYRDDPKFTVMLAVWGQFLDHDLTATAGSQAAGGRPISCCDSGQKRDTAHPECFPVHLDKADPYFQYYNITCMEFVRSAPAKTCRLGPREQINQASAYIDGSVVYGSDEEVCKNLRTLTNGTLKMFTTDDNRSLLPVSEDVDDGCNREEELSKGRYCFATGDTRSNENLHLTSMHLLWARHHNILASKLQKENPHWGDERLFQETRRILGAQMQHITYNEFLPILIGQQLMEKHQLNPQKDGYYKGYDENLDASMANSFAASAFRFAHTLIPTLMKLLSNDTSSPEFIQLHKMLLDPFKLYMKGELDSILRGAMHTKIQASDPYFSPELKEHLFERDSDQENLHKEESIVGISRKLCGLDLVSLNIQRGRDHGLPSYTNWRQRCGLHRPQTFKQLKGDIDDDSLHYIEAIYSDVDDIDLYTGALSEKPRPESILGSTITCLILDQFVRLKRGDRFWYENEHSPYRFTPEQLNEIRKTKLSNIICDNADDVTIIQPYVMRQVTKGNENINCSKLEKPNYSYWKEKMNKSPITDEKMLIRAIKKET